MTTKPSTVTVATHDTSSIAPLHPLYRRYPSQTAPQGAYVELLCEDDILRACYSPEIGNAVPVGVWCTPPRILRWSVNNELTATEINDLLDEVLPMAERIVAGYERVWDGSNHVGRYTEDADLARQEAETLCEEWYPAYEGGVVDASDHYAECPPQGITDDMTDEALAALIDEEEKEARGDGWTVDGLDDYLTALRNERRVEHEEGCPHADPA